MNAPIDWHARAKAITFSGKAFIDGQYVPATNGETFSAITPTNGAVLTEIASCDTPDVDRAVGAARRSFEAGVWSMRAPAERKAVLLHAAELIEAARDELALLETLDMGKPIADSLRVDVPASVLCLRWYAEAADKLYDEIAPTGPSARAFITREPIGVVGAVVPWNFPMMMAMWKLAPALMAGNSVILKPAEQSSLTALRLGQIFAEAGLPPGVLNVVPGLGHRAGKAIGLHPDVDLVTFTGSTEVGKLFLQYAGQSNMKRISLECGGKSPHVVLADSPDLDTVAKAVSQGIFFNQGEMCTAGSRLLVDRRVKDELLEKVVGYARQRRIGDPLDTSTDVGALVEQGHMDRVLGYIGSGLAEGANLAIGGERVLQDTGGYFVAPTVLDGVTRKMKVAQEEIFGPVLATVTFDGMEEGIEIANDSIYGLAAAVWTRDINTAFKAARALKSGMVYVNCYDRDDYTVPFGGFKQSGTGRDKSLHAIEKYTELKTTWIAIE